MKYLFTKDDGTMQFYLDMTIRKFKVRIKKHVSYIEYKKIIMALARLYSKERLQIDFNNIE